MPADYTPHTPCATCGACCRSYVVPLYGYDVWLLSSRQRLSPEQFVVACPQAEPQLDGFRLDAAGPTFGLALDKKGDFDVMNSCVFLMELGEGHARCGVYADRPVVCRAYPMSIWHLEVSQMKDSLCPPGSWPQTEVKRPAWRAALQHLYMQADIYHEIVARWNAYVSELLNRQPELSLTLEQYFDYMLNAYAHIDAFWSQLSPEQREQIIESWPTTPRPGVDAGKLRIQSGEMPWLEYLLAVRDRIDTFYPGVERQPLLALRRSDTPLDTNPPPEARLGKF